MSSTRPDRDEVLAWFLSVLAIGYLSLRIGLGFLGLAS